MSSLADRRPLMLVLAVLVGVGVAACTGSPATSSSAPTATSESAQIGPVLVRGRVVDASGAPVGGAQLMLQVFDLANSQQGRPMPLVFDQTYVAGRDGIFEIRLAPNAPLAAFATQNDSVLNFHMTVISGDGSLVIPAGFSREVVGTGWGGAIPILVITPSGVQQGNGDVPALVPAAS
ncbi:MAG: hypothetical protein ABI620_05935 [Chloroflexota bacterium]